MYEAKTKPTRASVTAHLEAIEDDVRRADCKALAALMERVTGCAPQLWGPAIVGFDSYHYKYASGHEGDSCLVGFASRKSDISIYLTCGGDDPESERLLARLGKHKMGKGCLYVRRLADVDLSLLEQLVARSAATLRRRYPQAPAPRA